MRASRVVSVPKALFVLQIWHSTPRRRRRPRRPSLFDDSALMHATKCAGNRVDHRPLIGIQLTLIMWAEPPL